jgi:BirA family biotin operon repressor/biotin-[acetyl-CoA-carboxylase] ligase
LNVNQENFPPTLKNPVSLKIILGKEQRIDHCFSALCSSIERRYLQLKAGHADLLNEDYLSALFRFGVLQEYESGQERFEAKLIAIGDDGKIFLKHENGLMRRYDFKEVKFIV